MPDPTSLVPQPSESEEVRLLAAALADLQTVVEIIVNKRLEFLPGEASEEIAAAWADAHESFTTLTQQVLQAARPPTAATTTAAVTLNTLREHQLIGPVGAAKRSMFARLRDAFYSYWNSLPQTDDKRIKAAHVAVDVLECGASVAGSVGGAIGGPVEEFLLLLKQGLSVRLRRGH